ncbi:MAG: DegT/DnrJ/EryC1/StrS family aminotransferase [Abditibacteriales bacterium]|nr:DegT/DnrJ/EryC1/StrS family aminotransferase [Abditibacteriales bacterium]MDW8364495.1 DegT/DnrJ/EryC1/StrS family aminotransferase [Abditibacteriales bacterium]
MRAFVDHSLLQSPPAQPCRVEFMPPSWGAAEFAALARAMMGATHDRADLEKAACLCWNVPYALAVNLGRSAMALGLRAAGLREGEEVILPAFVCRTVAQAVLEAGGVPVFADVDEHFNLSPESVERCLSARTRAVLMVHQYGRLADVDALRSLARQHDLILVDDAAVATGTAWRGVMAGAWGDFGVVSFNEGKNLQAGGGGLLLTHHRHIFEAAASDLPEPSSDAMWRTAWQVWHRVKRPLTQSRGYRAAKSLFKRKKEEGLQTPPVTVADFYRQVDGIPPEWWGASHIPAEYRAVTASRLHFIPQRMNGAQAAIACVQLQRLDEIVRSMTERARWLTEQLSSIPDLALPHGQFPQHVYSYYTLRLLRGSRYALARHLSEQGIQTQWTFYPLHKQERFAGYRRDHLPRTEKLWQQTLSLPVHPASDVQYVAEKVREFFE